MALNKTVLVPVTNISNSTVGYNLPELNVSRHFSPNEVKQISVGELRSLEYSDGGATLIRKFFYLDSPELMEEFGIVPEVEANWLRADVEKLLQEGSLEELQDALDFAPAGVKEMIQDVAVADEINDLSKREAIRVATGLDVTKAIEITKVAKEDDTTTEEKKPATRRVQPTAAKETRRVVSRGDTK